MFPFGGGEFGRQVDLRARVEIATVTRVADFRHAITLETKHLATLGEGGNSKSHRPPLDGSDLDLAAEDRGCDGHRHLEVQIPPLSLELEMGGEAHAQVQVARWGAARAGFTFSDDPHP